MFKTHLINNKLYVPTRPLIMSYLYTDIYDNYSDGRFVQLLLVFYYKDTQTTTTTTTYAKQHKFVSG